ncbi:MAG TPA: DMT family transporter [Xanthobacteraceae bacterium]|nr:DMT family transporter [Xanthobacteraceae bacterium]
MTPAQLVPVVLWMTGTLLSFSAMAVSIRELSRTLGILEILALRSALGVVVLLALALARPALWRSLSVKRLPLHLMRNGVHFVSQVAWATSLTLLPLATVFSLEFTMPAWTALLAALFLHERMTPSRIGAVVLGFIGVLVIIRPGLQTFQPAAFLTLAAAFGYAITLTATKRLTATDATFGIVFWMNVMQLPMNLAGSDPLFWLKLGTAQIVPMIGLGIAGLTSHYCLSNAFRAGEASLVVPLDFLRIPLIALVGWSLYGEPLDVFVFAGAGLIISGILWNLRAETMRPAPLATASNTR